jgi:hypothetical protein
MKTLWQMLDYREFGPTFRAKTTIEAGEFTQRYFGGLNRQTVHGDQVKLITVNVTNTPGKANTRTGPPNVIQPRGGSDAFHSLIRQFDEMPLDGDALRALREMESDSLNRLGSQVVAEQMDHVATQFALFKEVAIAHIVTYGRLNLSVDNELLLPTVHATTGAITDNASAHVSADFGVPNAMRGNLGGIIDTKWSDASAKIGKQLEALRVQAAKDGKVLPNTIYMNTEDKYYLRDNTEFKAWAQYHGMRAEQVLAGDGISDLWGFNWVFLTKYYTDSTGTQRPIIPSKTAMIHGEIGSWLRGYDGIEILSMNPQTHFASADEAVAQLTEVSGQFAYADIKRNPVTVSAFYGDNWGLGFAQPNIWNPTVIA